VSDEIEYIEPTQEHVGQMVEVWNLEGLAPKPRQLLAVLPPDIPYRFICRDCVDERSVSHWKYARIARQSTYAERQAKCGLKVGDRVLVLRDCAVDEQGYGVAWNHRCMDKTIGEVMAISDTCQYLGIYLNGFWYPYFVLEKVEDRVATHLDIGATVYVDGAPEDEFTLSHAFIECKSSSREAFGVVRSGDKRFVYELSNLRVKE